MPPTALRRLLTTPSRKFAVLVVLGMCMVAWPMAELWRRLGLELRASSAAQGSVLALALNVQTQQALAAHRPYAAAVLAGRLEQEGERARRQREVDLRLATLGQALEAQRLYRALDESDQLRGDWSALLQGIGLGRLAPAASDASHHLLIEQTYVIGDLVAAATGLHGQAGRTFTAAEGTLALVALPRYAAALISPQAPALPGPAVPGPAATNAADLAASGHALRTSARRVAHACAEVLAEAGATAGERRPEATLSETEDRGFGVELLAALMALQQSAKAIALGTAADGPGRGGAEQRALAATLALLQHFEARFEQAQVALRLERALAAAGGLAALLVAMLAAALALPRAGEHTGAEPLAAHVDDADAAEGAESAEGAVSAVGPEGAPTVPLHLLTPTQRAESEQPTSELLQRLRRSDIGASVDIDVDTGEAGGLDPANGR